MPGSNIQPVIGLMPGEPTFGLWCPICNLPSGYSVRVYVFTANVVRSVGVYRRCHDCGTKLAGDGQPD
jgi:hypothetical protein